MIAKFALLFFSVSVLTTVGCGGGGGGDSVIYDPVWIAASWSGGRTGTPSDRTDVEPENYLGQLCPASSVLLTNQSGGFAGITIINNCTLAVTYYICASKGSLPQPDLGLAECATDPLETPLSQFTIVPLNPGAPGFSINATEEISINVLYCSDTQQLNFLETPLTCL